MKYFLPFIFLAFIIGIGTSPAYAHFLQIDNTIGSVMHIDPDDDPYVGQPAVLTFYLKDTANLLDINDCNCMLTIKEGNKQLFSKTINAAAEGFTDNTVIEGFTFPERAVYTITLSGTPTDGKKFQPFTVNYDIRVDREDANAAKHSALLNFLGGHTIHYILFGGAAVFAFFVILRDKRREKSNNKTI